MQYEPSARSGKRGGIRGYGSVPGAHRYTGARPGRGTAPHLIDLL